ncbi:uncharacterized protein BDR25DRAFT_215080 [Lindgomyces ingoldianus]|uniref:Uncharacterized protein n=1 Tax=Lindgomyces ingoldianus TaxID=673940 RepID=A0ACB6R6D0_9PLEO|nr:uncharacterized protein BDR25DRAFT_215080 [Lindgomyces ingoldianus]KAF2474859.1 hypothetical protein BDR25DRAFT_215080 [Lindgomyces ingoldianus]
MVPRTASIQFTTPLGNSSREYLESVASREIAWIKTSADSWKATKNALQYTSIEQHSLEAHIASLQKYLSIIPYIIPNDFELVLPRIWHPDFHAGNIYIDDCGRISSIIEWQGAWTTPVFIGANPPLLLDYGIDIMMKLPDGFKELDEGTKDQL